MRSRIALTREIYEQKIRDNLAFLLLHTVTKYRLVEWLVGIRMHPERGLYALWSKQLPPHAKRLGIIDRVLGETKRCRLRQANKPVRACRQRLH